VAPGSRNDPPRSRLQYGDILLSNSGVASLGRPALFLERGDFNISQHLNLIRVQGIDTCFVTVYLHTEFGRAQMRRLYSGTGAAGLSYDDIRSLRLPVLPQSDQAAVRQAFMRVHAAHVEAMDLRAAGDAFDRSEETAAFQLRIGRARALLTALIEAVEAHILAPSESGLRSISKVGTAAEHSVAEPRSQASNRQG
jgi:type I restriction enzyme S subunit